MSAQRRRQPKSSRPPPGGSLPKRVKVGAWDYTIEIWEAKQANSERKFGASYGDCKKILIDTSYGPQQAASTLLHEIFHCVYHRWKIEKGFDEEQTIDRLMEGLAAVWRDNPAVMAWIGQLLAKP